MEQFKSFEWSQIYVFLDFFLVNFSDGVSHLGYTCLKLGPSNSI
jgi:hypothetical protein